MFPSVLGDKPWQRVQADADDAGLATESFGPDQFFSERLDQAVPGRETGGGMRGIQPGQLPLVRSQLAHEPYRQREKHCVRYEIPRQDADAPGAVMLVANSATDATAAAPTAAISPARRP